MNFSSMEYFAELARERSFTKAARRLHITQQTLSAHIATMEKELGCKLVVRTSPLKLTYAGEELLQYAKKFLEDLDAMKREFCDISENQRGTLRIGIASTRGRVVMPRIIQKFQQSFPNIRIELVEATNEVLQQNLVGGKTDLAVARFPKPIAAVTLHDFYEEDVVLVVPNDLGAATSPGEKRKSCFAPASSDTYSPEEGRCLSGLERLAALDGFPFVLGSSEDIAGRIGRRLIEKAGIRPKVRALSDNAGTILSLCSLGVGACFCPKNLVEATLSAEQLAKMTLIDFGSEARYPIRFGCRQNFYQWSAMAEFIRVAKEAYPPSRRTPKPSEPK